LNQARRLNPSSSHLCIIITTEDWSPFILTELSQSWWVTLMRSVLSGCRHNHSGLTSSNDTPATPFTTVCCTKAEDSHGVLFVLLDDDDAWVCWLYDRRMETTVK
jgi:hypothetical protein